MPIRSGFHHVAVNVRDLQQAIAFYEALGAKCLRVWPTEAPTAAMVDIGGSRLEFFCKGEGDPEADAMIPHFALVSDDVDGDYALALSLGAKSHTEPKDICIPSEPAFPARIAFFTGLSGEVVELFQEKG